ncbi:MAG TPA: PKD domain-containing protein [Chthoniobacterales bacterium]
MKHVAKNHTCGSVLRPLLAALLTLGGIALLAQAGGPTTSVSAPAPMAAAGAQAPKGAAATPGQPRFFNYYAPPGIGEDVGEPSIGSNWQTEKTHSNSLFQIPNGGTTLFYGGLDILGTPLLRITFDDCPSPANALWEEKHPPLNQTPRAAGDPILFTDSITGRTFISQLEGLTPAGSSTDITDDDGETFTPSEGSSLPSDIDHQTFGGGRYHDPAPPGAGVLYPHAVYYASQSVADARAALSIDGGVTFGPGFPMYTIDDCAGLHGHIKVSPKDGTVYVPNRGCDGAVPFHETGARQAVVVSEDNGITWDVRPIPDATTHGSGSLDNSILGTRDPSVAIDADGTVYFTYQSEERATGSTDPADKAGDSLPKVAVSHDKGLTWQPSVYIGANVINGGPVRNATFMAATAGSGGRAAVAFFGTETGGNNWQCGEGDDCSGDAMLFPRDPFTGVWYLYVSVTYDGGQTWITQNVTPGDPIQRGGICGGGTCRNLLDFMDIQIDKQGRILVAGEDGCIGTCVTGGANSFTAKAFVTRQSGGKTLFAAFDPVEPVLAGAPKVQAGADAAKTKVELTWQAPDNGGSDITAYNIYRRAGDTGAFTLIATESQTHYVDTTFDPAARNFYRVTAVNAVGEGPYCVEVEPVIVPPPNPCQLPGIRIISDPAGDGLIAERDIRELYIAELFDPAVTANKIFFTMKVEDLAVLPPQSRWTVYFTRNNPGSNPPTATEWFVAMRTDDRTGPGSNLIPIFTYGHREPPTTPGTSGTLVTDGNVDFGTYDPDGTIVIGIATPTKTNATGRDFPPLQTGEALGTVNAVTQQTVAALLVNDDDTGTGSYTLVGNAACALNQAPTAKLVANPDMGNPPLTVSFDGSTSVDPDAGDSVASYTFSFGDGSPNVTQASPTIQHTYKHGGGFFATLTVNDSHGLQSANVASVPIKVAAQLLNLSTRLRVEPGDRALIGGLIILGSEPKKVILRGIGPSLTINGSPFPGRLEDPTLELYNSAGVPIASNDEWKSNQAEVEATGAAPTNDHESAIVRTLDPGSYTVILRGKNNTSGVALVETYDIGLPANSRLGNLSSRGFIGTGDDILIGGFFAGPQTAAVTRVVLRAMGPSLAAFKVPDPMQDPTLEVRDRNGELLAANDNWETDQKAAIQAAGLAPGDSRESAIVMTNFEPGPYTAVVRGKDGNTGIGLVEIYDVQQ